MEIKLKDISKVEIKNDISSNPSLELKSYLETTFKNNTKISFEVTEYIPS